MRFRSARSRSASATASSRVMQRDRLPELRRRDGRGAALHDDDTARDVGQGRRLERGRTTRQGQGERADHRVARPGDVGDLVGAVDRNEGGRPVVLERLDARLLLVTRGSRGMALLERDGATTFIPIHGTDEIADVTGAGDTVISTFTLALASGATPLQAATLANVAGGLVVMKRGTATVLPSELRQAITLHDS